MRSSYSQNKVTNQKTHKTERDSAAVNMTRVHPDQGAFLDKSPVCHCTGRCTDRARPLCTLRAGELTGSIMGFPSA